MPAGSGRGAGRARRVSCRSPAGRRSGRSQGHRRDLSPRGQGAHRGAAVREPGLQPGPDRPRRPRRGHRDPREAPDRFHVVQGADDVGRLELALEPRRPVGLPHPDDARHRRDGRDRRGAAASGSPRSPRPRPTTSATRPRTARMRFARSLIDATSCSWWALRTRPTRPAWWRWPGAKAAAAELIEDVSQLRARLARRARRPSGSPRAHPLPTSLVQEVLDTLRLLGPVRLSEERTAEETVRFSLPTQVR